MTFYTAQASHDADLHIAVAIWLLAAIGVSLACIIGYLD